MPDTPAPATPAAADGTPVIVPDGAPAATPPADNGVTAPSPAADRTDADIDAIAQQAQNPDAVRNALVSERQAARAERERANAAEARVAEFERSAMTDQQRADAELAELRGQVSELAPTNMRLRVALEKGVPADLVDRLRGATKEELERDADDLMTRLNPNPSTPPPDLGGGARPRDAVAGGQSMDDLIRNRAGRG